ncbi:hypothetical protein Enr17x_32620 [Gimesia fumaroli]|uniref:Methyltransferase FkbM domain-containing protein n=2 Tax=Gimesia fumaroli TaxID=2527976 RepID=A0A518IDP1_9PLAN|nr:hypothetical protein Enr17x_32620 [Gimesia fumaroli]
MKPLIHMLDIDSYPENQNAIVFCDKFLHGKAPKYILGRNEWAQSIAEIVEVDGFIDDFTKDKEFLGKPVLRIVDLPENGMVVSANVLGRPLTVQKKLNERNVRHIDYYAFRKYIGNRLKPVMFWDHFKSDFESNRDKYEWIYQLLQDEQSKKEFTKIVNFRLSSDLTYMTGFTDAQHRQYFEDFLNLQSEGEIFIDVGSFDGYTSLEFIKRCPNYAGVHIFEPEPQNMSIVKQKLKGYHNLTFHSCGLSNQAQTLCFSVNGSASRISEEGEIQIKVDRLDDRIPPPVTFLKMDIEGGEVSAIEGAQSTISKYHPKLAISVYHLADDFWNIPEKVLSIRDDYDIFLRHYTEGVVETVMFFVPKQ